MPQKKWVPRMTFIEFSILRVIRDGGTYGSRVSESILERTHGELDLQTGTLYAALDRLSSIQHGWLERTGEKRKWFYHITPRGLRVLRNETARLQHIVDRETVNMEVSEQLWVPRMTFIEFYILGVLRDKETYGLQIRKSVEEQTEGEVKLYAGHLYPTLDHLSGAKHNWIEAIGEDTGDKRQRHYRLTQEGRNAYNNEIARMKRIVDQETRSAGEGEKE
jgi:PadR family transcriptional regulator PadR